MTLSPFIIPADKELPYYWQEQSLHIWSSSCSTPISEIIRPWGKYICASKCSTLFTKLGRSNICFESWLFGSGKILLPNLYRTNPPILPEHPYDYPKYRVRLFRSQFSNKVVAPLTIHHPRRIGILCLLARQPPDIVSLNAFRILFAPNTPTSRWNLPLPLSLPDFVQLWLSYCQELFSVQGTPNSNRLPFA